MLNRFFRKCDIHKVIHSMTKCGLDYNNPIHQYIYILSYYGLSAEEHLKLLYNVSRETSNRRI